MQKLNKDQIKNVSGGNNIGCICGIHGSRYLNVASDESCAEFCCGGVIRSSQYCLFELAYDGGIVNLSDVTLDCTSCPIGYPGVLFTAFVGAK